MDTMATVDLTRRPVTILDLAKYRGVKANDDGSITGGEFERVGLAIMGGCEVCGASIAAYNAYPCKTGYWRCSGCLSYELAWFDVKQADREIFGEDFCPVCGEKLDEPCLWHEHEVGG